MTALAQGTAGLAFVMSFALLVCGRTTAAAILLAVQSGAVAVTALVVHQPLLAIPPLALAAGIGLLRHEIPDPLTVPPGGAKRDVAVGAVLTILCQSLGTLALPTAIVLLSVLLAATRGHKLMRVIALIAMQNGLALAASLVAPPGILLLPVACLALPLPLGAALLIPRLTSRFPMPWTFAWFGWVDLGVALAMLAATLVAPLDPLATLFAPLLALDGVMRAWVRRNRSAMTAPRRGFALAQTGFTVLAVCAPITVAAWLAVLAAMAMALLPRLSRRWDGPVLACLAAGLALFGILLLAVAPPVLGWFSLFAGFVTIAAVVPNLVTVLVVLVLRLANQGPWPVGAETTGIVVAVVGLLVCALLLVGPGRSHRVSLLSLGQASIALMSLCIGQEEGRFAALVLLVLLILTRAAARVSEGPVCALAVAGLAGVPPLGAFPGLVLVVLAVGGHEPWLLVPLAAALVPIVLTSLPEVPLRLAVPSIAWLPLALAALAGYFAPDELVRWLHVLIAGRT